MNKLTSVLLITSVAIFSGCSPQEEAKTEEVIRPVKTTTIVESGLQEQKSYPAIVLPAQQAELSFRSSGQIFELPVRAATEVKEDDIIAKLDTRDFESQVVALESQLEQAKAQLDGLTSGARDEDLAALKANIAAAEAQFTAAREQLLRTQDLYDKGIVAKAKLDGDQANVDVAAAQLEAARQELIKGETGGRKEDVAAQIAVIKGVEANLNVAKDNLANATLRAPFDGIIASRAVDNFANVQAKQTIVTLQRIEDLELSFDIPGPDVAKISPENPPSLSVSLDSIPGSTFEAEFAEFNTIANSTTQTFTGRVSIEQPQGATILPGMTGMVIVTAPETQQASILLDVGAIVSDPGGESFVWSVDSGVVKKQKVRMGDAVQDKIAILEGIAVGDVVVTAGTSFLQEGMKVRLMTGEE